MRPPLVYVAWEDSSSPQGRAWWRVEGFDDEPVICASVGWLVKKSKRTVTISGHLDDEMGKSFANPMIIPRSAIRLMKSVSVGKRKIRR